MATLSQTVPARSMTRFGGPRGLVDTYFYFAMALVFPAIVVAGFSRTVDQSLFHAAPARPLLLWFHGAVFSAWVVFFLFQSVLVRTRNLKWHRLAGWFGAALGATMVPVGITTAIVMGRFDTNQLHLPDSEPFLIIPFFSMALFGTLLTLAITWRRKPELHRRLLFIATCCLLDAPFARFDFIFDHSLFLFCDDILICLGIARDLLVNRRIHRVYLIALPLLIVSHALVTFIWRSGAHWWVRIAHAILA